MIDLNGSKFEYVENILLRSIPFDDGNRAFCALICESESLRCTSLCHGHNSCYFGHLFKF